MKLKIASVADKGNLERERVVLKVASKGDISAYAIMGSPFDQDGDISSTG